MRIAPPTPIGRIQIVYLWLAVVARAFGLEAVRVYALTELALTQGFQGDTAKLDLLMLWVLLSALPAVVLAPLWGKLASLPSRRLLMLLSSAAAAGVAVWVALLRSDFQIGVGTNATFPWLAALLLLSVEATFFATCRFALVPQLSRGANVPMPQLQAFFLVGIVGAGLGGAWLALDYEPLKQLPGVPPPLQAGIVGYALSFIFMIGLNVPASLGKPRVGLFAPLFATAKVIYRRRYAFFPLLGLWACGLASMALRDPILRDEWLNLGLAICTGMAVTGLHWHSFRAVGFVAFASLAFLGGAIYGVWNQEWAGVVWLMGISLGAMVLPLLASFSDFLEDERQGFAGAILFAGWGVVAIGFGLFAQFFAHDVANAVPNCGYLLLATAVALALLAWFALFRTALELVMESIFVPLYRIRVKGPGARSIPCFGPGLVIANHAAWLDPLWLGKSTKPPLTPVMVSRFYDLPGIVWVMRQIIGTVRVPDVGYRKEAPELLEIVAALDRGETVMIFPEGWLRRKEEVPIRRFGRGVWEVLRVRPNTPVYPCWIERSWGSFFSHYNGPPTKNKPFDKLYRIEIAIGEGEILEPEVLADHMLTRAHLMERVVEAREILGLAPFQTPAAAEGDEGKES